jgi:hypothetical protein
MKMFLFTVILTVVALSGCAMFTSWTSIPPPGGCDRCHTVAISANWRATITPVQLTAEDGKPAWQREGSVLPPATSPVEQQLLSDERCFRCHNEPSTAHGERRGSYHHRARR